MNEGSKILGRPNVLTVWESVEEWAARFRALQSAALMMEISVYLLFIFLFLFRPYVRMRSQRFCYSCVWGRPRFLREAGPCRWSQSWRSRCASRIPGSLDRPAKVQEGKVFISIHFVGASMSMVCSCRWRFAFLGHALKQGKKMACGYA